MVSGQTILGVLAGLYFGYKLGRAVAMHHAFVEGYAQRLDEEADEAEANVEAPFVEDQRQAAREGRQ